MYYIKPKGYDKSRNNDITKIVTVNSWINSDHWNEAVRGKVVISICEFCSNIYGDEITRYDVAGPLPLNKGIDWSDYE